MKQIKYLLHKCSAVRGFTLIEAVITMGVSVVALLALVNLFFVFNSIYGYQQAFIATARSAGTTLNAIEAAVLPAGGVLASHTFSGTDYASATSTLVLELPAVAASGAIVAGAKDYVAFYAASSTLYRLVLADPQSVRASGLTKLTTTLSALSFVYNDSDFTKVTRVAADLTTRALYKEQEVQARLSEAVYLRNFSSAP